MHTAAHRISTPGPSGATSPGAATPKALPAPAAALAADRSVVTTGLDACLTAIARAAVDVFRPANRARLAWCEGADCTRAFLDASRANNRRWCGRAGCGDRAKAAA